MVITQNLSGSKPACGGAISLGFGTCTGRSATFIEYGTCDDELKGSRWSCVWELVDRSEFGMVCLTCEVFVCDAFEMVILSSTVLHFQLIVSNNEPV
jgi:hypothetical protein